MLAALKDNWKNYLIEGWALGMFMVSACFFVLLLEHPRSPFHLELPSAVFRRFLMGLAMGLTAVLLIYSSWGKRSGAHMNPAVTLAFWQMERISTANAIWYILAQFIGGALGVFLFKWTVPQFIAEQGVQYAVTMPGPDGVGIAFFSEFIISFVLLGTVLLMSNSKYADYTGWVAGILLVAYITIEAPFSGMSMNPARTVASALPSNIWTAWWVYFIAPIGGMMLAGFIYRRWYRWSHGGNCLTMKCHLSGKKHDCETYEVLGPAELLEQQAETSRSGMGHI
ncbi:MAG: aquaporin [Lewinellaceae bacterium]|nr:aquaporin [Saprospiraceae bacterium]MCB9339033.1 aquaporin [Lewinellaceae bacterium]